MSFYWCFVLSIPFYSFFTYAVLKKYGDSYGVVIAVIAPLSLELYVRIKDFNGSLVSLPTFFSILLGIFTGVLMYNWKNKIGKAIYAAVVAVFATWVFFYGYPRFIFKLNYGTFTGDISEPAPKFAFVDSVGNRYEKFEGITVLDFWDTHCGVCFQKFPLLQQLYTQYKQQPGVRIYAANLPVDDNTPLQAFSEITERNYTFPVLKSDEIIDTTLKKFKFTGVPTVIVLDGSNEIKYRGDVEGVDKVIKKLLASK